jgi:superfamily I DNA/RNA helicase
MEPTQEQNDATDCFVSGVDMKVNAFAGSGKTSTLKLMANARTSPGVYLCFNKGIADQASREFPEWTACKTTHSFAFRQIITRMGGNSQKMIGSLRAADTVKFLRLSKFSFKASSLEATTLGYVINQTVRNFCLSADEALGKQHFFKIPRFELLDDEEFQAIRNSTVKYAFELWESMTDPSHPVPLGHDGYVKLWQLSNPVIDTCYVMVDEAQDTNPVLLDVLNKQDCQVIFVGDRHQQIYEWRGAINAMDNVEVEKTIYLTKSFRFGQAIADLASNILRTIGETARITGNENINSRIITADASVVLCRTNGQILDTLIEVNTNQPNVKVGVQGGVEDLLRCMEGVERLQDKRTSAYPLFLGFVDWDEFLQYAQESGDGEAAKMVKLVDSYGVRSLRSALLNVLSPDLIANADLFLTTAHKAKGREWDAVRLADDFQQQPVTDENGDKRFIPSETRLFYVAATRAINDLTIPGWAKELYLGA